MKIGSSTENVLITTGTESRQKLTIQASGRAFAVLSDALYTHKVRAIVREIGCNAYDAHIMARNIDTPFDVSLPCTQDPFFKVRDYGVGLSEESFVSVYTTYFGSNKANSNDFTGGFGLGSKTPFIMSKTFTVISYYNGMEYMWNAFVNDNGEPEVMLVYKKETSEPNGLLVSVPIGAGASTAERAALFTQFASEAKLVYKWFEVQPNVRVGGESVEIPRFDNPKSKYEKIRVIGVDPITAYYCNNVGHKQSATIQIKMGNVVYPFDLSVVSGLERFGGDIAYTQRVIKYLTSTSFLNTEAYPLVLDVPMGAVDIAPSREALSLNNAAELFVVNAVLGFIRSHAQDIQHKIDAASSIAEQYELAYSFTPLQGIEFTIDNQPFSPKGRTPIWAFNTTQPGKAIRTFGVDYSYRYRKAGRRGLLSIGGLPVEVAMYATKKGLEPTILLIDAPYKGEMREWVSSNFGSETEVMVIAGKGGPTGNLPIPLTDVEMQPFLEDKHPRVFKISELKTKPASNSKPSVKTADLNGTAVMMRTSWARGNNYTVGNTFSTPINDLINPKDKTVIYIAVRKGKGTDIEAEVAVPGVDIDKTEFVRVGLWSRAMSSTTDAQCAAGSLSDWFSDPAISIGTGYTLLVNGVHIGLKAGTFKQVVLSADMYNEVVDKHDHIFSVHRALKVITSQMIKHQCHHMVFTDTTAINGTHARYLNAFYNCMQLDDLYHWMTTLVQTNTTGLSMQTAHIRSIVLNHSDDLVTPKHPYLRGGTYVVTKWNLSFDSFRRALDLYASQERSAGKSWPDTYFRYSTRIIGSNDTFKVFSTNNTSAYGYGDMIKAAKIALELWTSEMVQKGFNNREATKFIIEYLTETHCTTEDLLATKETDGD